MNRKPKTTFKLDQHAFLTQRLENIQDMLGYIIEELDRAQREIEFFYDDIEESTPEEEFPE